MYASWVLDGVKQSQWTRMVSHRIFCAAQFAHFSDGMTVWQIAQRDYKFGKGKHSSLTKATYDAVGNRFRALWGKEAGWAHSVLFTADLRAFSERLIEKIDSTAAERIVKLEPDAVVKIDSVTTLQASRKRTKRAIEETKREEILVEEDKFSKIKRRRRK